jgi:hypothetical protein
MFKIIVIVLVIAALVAIGVSLLRKLVQHSAPLALACAIVLTVFVAPVWAAHAVAVLVVAGVFYVATI